MKNKNKFKKKMKTRNIMEPSYHSNATSTQNKGVPLFSCVAHVMWGQVKVFQITLT